ncbi:hypothetical protein BW731_11675 [Vagococcus martis]|uniref:Uncharacterized protein n=1 Tax=Vagococcus martis TaxID=1768210 RepID=A0A1V4DKJ8_9ENTE|nr:hypothetical protein [Vagococcus martis]OPF88780.1 hypothetical protein BW731_11675 [Vagococcus martis]
MDSKEVILESEHKIDSFKKSNELAIKKNINQEIKKVQDSVSEDMWDKELTNKIEDEVNVKLTELNNSIDINPTALYYSLKAETALNPDISEKQLTLQAFKFLVSKTNNKFLKKILKDKVNKLEKDK